MAVFTFMFVIWMVCGFSAAIMANNKGRSAVGFFFAGVFLGVFGVLWAWALHPPRVALMCSNCLLRQDVPADNRTYRCYQCGGALVYESKPLAAPPGSPNSRSM
jgi:hypothetical protein